MFALMSSPTIMMSTQQRFKKFGKETRERRKSELDKIGDTFKGIAEDEKKRAKKLFEEHKAFFTTKESSTSTSTTPAPAKIDFYEQ
tara:strand:- start:2533 stop:2790 length:258 start_codon:yes stop_codon:yes gene_type:complete